MPASVVLVEVRIVNLEALEKFADAIEAVEEAADDMPWRDDLAEAAENLRAAARSLRAETVPHGGR